MKDALSTVLMLIAVACAVVVTGLLVRREFASAGGRPDPGVEVRNWRSVAVSRHVEGRADARVVLVEFFDFQCPACRRMSYAIDSVRDRRGSGLRVVRRHFPIQEIHPRAYTLALGGVCAASQGAFTAYYRTVFDRQRAIGAPDWPGIMSLLDPTAVDTNRFRACLDDPVTAGIVDGDIAAARALGITSTPSFLINHRLYQGSRSAAALDSLIERAQ